MYVFSLINCCLLQGLNIFSYFCLGTFSILVFILGFVISICILCEIGVEAYFFAHIMFTEYIGQIGKNWHLNNNKSPNLWTLYVSLFRLSLIFFIDILNFYLFVKFLCILFFECPYKWTVLQFYFLAVCCSFKDIKLSCTYRLCML